MAGFTHELEVLIPFANPAVKQRPWQPCLCLQVHQFSFFTPGKLVWKQQCWCCHGMQGHCPCPFGLASITPSPPLSHPAFHCSFKLPAVPPQTPNSQQDLPLSLCKPLKLTIFAFPPTPHKTQCLVLRLHFHPKYSSKLIRHEILYAKTGTFPMGKQQSQSSQAWQETLSFQEPRVMWDKLNDATQQVSQRNTARAMTRPTRLKISQCLPTLYILLHLMCHNYSFLCTHSCVWGAALALPKRHWSTVGAGRQSLGAAAKWEESLRSDTAQGCFCEKQK